MEMFHPSGNVKVMSITPASFSADLAARDDSSPLSSSIGEDPFYS